MSVLEDKVENIKQRIVYIEKLIECGEAEKVADAWLVDRRKELNEAINALRKLES